MSESIMLSYDELKNLTGYTIASKQIDWLEKNGIKHYVNGARKPVVLRSTLTVSESINHNVVINNQQPDFDAI